MSAKPYILWDWNGTLLDDTRAAFDTLNIMLARRNAPPIEFGFYRDNFAFPVKPFYERIGMVLENEDWDALAREYHELYAAQPSKRLNPRALQALKTAKRRAAGQSIISALRQDLLEKATAECGVAQFMEFIAGVDNLDGASKLARARQLLEKLRFRRENTRFVLIGDALHDKEVADALAIDCVLCAEGSHAGWRLAKAAPTGDTLADALEIALSMR